MNDVIPLTLYKKQIQRQLDDAEWEGDSRVDFLKHELDVVLKAELEGELFYIDF